MTPEQIQTLEARLSEMKIAFMINDAVSFNEAIKGAQQLLELAKQENEFIPQ